MGLIKSGLSKAGEGISSLGGQVSKGFLGAITSTFADQWKEYFYCDSIPNDLLMVRGKKKIGEKSANTNGNDNIISSGSIIAVAAGQAMMIVEQGKVVEFCFEQGEFVYDASTEPSILNGQFLQGLDKESKDEFFVDLKKRLIETFKVMGKRFTFGGDTAKDQRVYYFNMKEILDNKFGTQNPIPFRIVDNNIGLDVDISIRCNGVYSYKIGNPILFYNNIAGNVVDEYKKEDLQDQLRSEFLTALQPALAKISALGIRYSALPAHTIELTQAMKEVLSPLWIQNRGLLISEVAINSATASAQDEEMIKDLQKTAVFKNPTMAAATITQAQAEAMKLAAKNENGAVMGFYGMNMAAQAGGMNNQSLYQMGQQQNQNQQNIQMPQQNYQNMNQNLNTDSWKCDKCGFQNIGGKFCQECGSPRNVNKKNIYKCSNCGFQPQDPTNPPKFCPECGNVFDENDIIK